MQRIPPRFIPLLMALGIGLLLALLIVLPSRHASPMIGKPLPDFMLPRLDAPARYLMPRDFLGQPALVNVFASWCQPCQAEAPLLLQLAGKVKIYGIAWRDTPANVVAFLQRAGNPYQVIAVDSVPVSTVPLGILGVPTTYLIDGKGVVRAKWDRPLDAALIEREVLPALQQAQP